MKSMDDKSEKTDLSATQNSEQVLLSKINEGFQEFDKQVKKNNNKDSYLLKFQQKILEQRKEHNKQF